MGFQTKGREKEMKELVELANSKGYNRFHPQWFENNKLEPDTELLEMVLLQKWIRETHGIEMWVEYGCVDSDTYEYMYEIVYESDDLQHEKRLCNRLKRISSFLAYGGVYTGASRNYKEIMKEGLIKALKIIKNPG